MGRWGAAAVVAAGLIAGTLAPAGPAAAVHGAAPGDFDGDGYRDVVLPIPGADVDGHLRAGAVVVLYGSANGVTTRSRRQVVTEDSPGVPGQVGAYDRFGTSTATADLNRDGYADLVVGTPFEGGGGTVRVLWGGRSGLGKGSYLPIVADGGDNHGLDVAAAGAGPGDRTKVLVGGSEHTTVYKGPFSSTGNAFASAYQIRWNGVVGSVALGDFDRNGTPDQVYFGPRRADVTGSDIVLVEDGFTGGRETLQWGNGLIAATGDVDGDGYPDLVVGDPLTPVTPGVDGELGGRVLVWRGSAGGLDPYARPEVITQDTEGVPGTSEKQDAFGAALAVADLDRDGAAEIVVGAPYEAVGTVRRAGMVTVIPGRRSGPLGAGGYSFHQDSSGIPSVNETRDCFGTTVSAGDVDGDRRPELFIGAACENHYNGAVFMLPGGTRRPTGTDSRVFTLDSLGMPQGYEGWLGGNGLFWVI
ncbi:FG-GAP repeat protein [Streptomyces sp. NPDC053367]|uniref:FG-GAP repeat protein n=1 Tax=Streptomyces sp. NPDC053367 TaxID=3365700 RepID=UPI0037D8EC76